MIEEIGCCIFFTKKIECKKGHFEVLVHLKMPFFTLNFLGEYIFFYTRCLVHRKMFVFKDQFQVDLCEIINVSEFNSGYRYRKIIEISLSTIERI